MVGAIRSRHWCKRRRLLQSIIGPGGYKYQHADGGGYGGRGGLNQLLMHNQVDLVDLVVEVVVMIVVDHSLVVLANRNSAPSYQGFPGGVGKAPGANAGGGGGGGGSRLRWLRCPWSKYSYGWCWWSRKTTYHLAFHDPKAS